MVDEAWLAELLAGAVRVVDLDADALLPEVVGPSVTIGVTGSAAAPVVPEAVDVVLAARPGAGDAVVVPDPAATAEALVRRIRQFPRAALSLVTLLRQTAVLPVRAGLAAESAVYSTLLAGPEFARWRAARPSRPVPVPHADPVLVAREGGRLTLTLNRPDRRNAFGVAVRDALLQGLQIAELDPSVTEVHLDGAGPDFCSGGDLDEFGTAADAATAHLVRLRHSAAARVDALAPRVTAHLHGACIGAGIEVPAFARTVVAREGTTLVLPELAMGLVPGAGGTVSVTRRIGRRRTAYLALSGARLDVVTALAWGLVDAVAD